MYANILQLYPLTSLGTKWEKLALKMAYLADLAIEHWEVGVVEGDTY